ncbi:MAG: sulfatase [Planctomycetes bacterium]|nr:sulfatase [Planctomycetota bacterium]
MNVLFIVLDDLRPELGCYGHDNVISPHIDKLAQESLLFDRAYCQQAVCAPSRCSVLSGVRPDTTEIYGLRTHLRENMPDVLTLPQHFKNNGYQSISLGKVYHHLPDDPQGWTQEPSRVSGDWKGRGYLTDEAIEAIETTNKEMKKKGSSRRGLGPAFEGADVPDSAYRDGKQADEAIEKLRELQGSDFFMGLGFIKPHLPFCCPRKYWDMYSEDSIQLPPNYFEPENVTKYSLTNFGELRGYFGMPESGPIPDGLARKLIHGYRACVSYVDAQVGRVLAELERLDMRKDTAIILWGDHGWKLGEHASWCKHTNFEIDARAPMILSVPGMNKPGSASDSLVEFVDMYPTLCDICDLPLPEHLEGQSLTPLLQDPARPLKKAAFSQYPRGGNIMGYTIRTDDFRYTEWQDHESGDPEVCELYDHRTDPQENHNVAENADYSETLRHLSEVLNQGWDETDG